MPATGLPAGSLICFLDDSNAIGKVVQEKTAYIVQFQHGAIDCSGTVCAVYFVTHMLSLKLDVQLNLAQPIQLTVSLLWREGAVM